MQIKQTIAKALKKHHKWDILSISYVILLTLLSIIRWNIYPIFIDIYYHIATMQGYNIANGITLNAYWEYAPFGRVQLYPPLLHIFMLTLLKMKFSIPFIAQITSFIMFPLTLFTIWFVISKVYNEKIAFFSTILLGSIVPFFWQSSVTSAASLAQILGLLSFYAIDKNRKVATPILFTLLLYSHIAIPYFYITSFIIYGLFKRDRRKLIFNSTAISFIFFSPWFVHTLYNLKYLHPRNAVMHSAMLVPKPIPLYIFIWFFGIIGMTFSIKKKNEYIWPLVLLLSLIPIAFSYPERFWSAHAFIPLAILGGSGLFAVSNISIRRKNRIPTAIKNTAIIMIITAIVLFTPTLRIGYNTRITTSYSLLPMLIKKPKQILNRNLKSKSLLTKKNFELADFIINHSSVKDTIYVSNGPLADFIFAFTGRCVSSGMLKEVKPYKRPLPTDCTLFVIEGNVDGLPPILNDHFTLLGKSGGYTIFKNKFTNKGCSVPKPIAPLNEIFIAIYFSFLIAVIDLSKNIDRK